MLSKIFYKSKYEVILFYTHRSPVTLWSGDGNILEFLDMFLTPLNSECTTLSEYEYKMKICEEDTQVINIEEVA